MRALIQRVTQATVTVKGTVKGSCRKGLLVLAGIEEADTQDDVDWLSGKIAGLRIFSDSGDKMNLSGKGNKRRDYSYKPVYPVCQHAERQPPILYTRGPPRNSNTFIQQFRSGTETGNRQTRGHRRVWRTHGGKPDK
jgi:hypothetical protein